MIDYNPCGEQGGSQPEIGELVAMGLGNALKDAVPAKPPQLVSHAAGGQGFGKLAEPRRPRLAQIAIAKAPGREGKGQQGVPKRLLLEIGKAHGRGALTVNLSRTIRLRESLFGPACRQGRSSRPAVVGDWPGSRSVANGADFQSACRYRNCGGC